MKRTFKLLIGIISLVACTGCACRTRAVAYDEPRAMMQPGSTKVAADGYQMKNVYFAFDRYDLSEGSKRTLQKNAAWLEENPGMTVRIEGHADERGTTQYNLALAKSRAITAADFLESLGIARDRIETISFGESRPLESSRSEDAWAKNRRVEFNALGDEGKVQLLE